MRDTRFRDARLRGSVANELARAFRLQNRAFNAALKPYGLSAVQANVLVVLWLEGAMTIGELQRILAIGSSTITGTIDRMEKAELVRRLPVEGDRRAYRIEPAPWPKKKREAVIDAAMGTEAELYATLTKTERAQLGRLLDKLASSME